MDAEAPASARKPPAERALIALETGLRLLPAPVKRLAKRASGPADVVLRASYRRRTGNRTPIAPAVIRARGGHGLRIDAYVGEGRRLVDAVDAGLRAAGRPGGLADVASIYDWGCGGGRFLQHLEGRVPASARVAGSDVDAEAVRWAQRAFPRYALSVSGFTPPLALPDHELDCLVSSSVFTHLTEADQDAWLAELHRVLAPTGVALVSIAGPAMHRRFLEGLASRGTDFGRRVRELPPLGEDDLQFVPYDLTGANAADFPGIDATYGMTFHGVGYVRRHWGRWFELVEVLPEAVNLAQDLLVLRPRAAG